MNADQLEAGLRAVAAYIGPICIRDMNYAIVTTGSKQTAPEATQPAQADYIEALPTPDRLVCGDLDTPDAKRDLAAICECMGWTRNKHALIDQDGIFRMRTADALRVYAMRHTAQAVSIRQCAGPDALNN